MDAPFLLLVTRVTCRPTQDQIKHPANAGYFISGGEITHKKYFFVGPDTGRTLLVRHRTKNKKHTDMCVFYFIWWPWSDSNRHSLQNLILSQARLPIPPRGQKATQQIILLPLCGIQPFSPNGHCDSLCVPVSLPVFRVSRFFC